MARTAMICDDAQFMRTVIKQILSEDGFEVVGEADSGQEAIERYAELKPDLVTMDVVMPGMSGIDAVRAIIEHDPAACVVICSAVGQKRLIVQALEAGARAFVVKPFQPQQLMEAVEQALDTANAVQDVAVSE